jgi:hypothetical protein
VIIDIRTRHRRPRNVGKAHRPALAATRLPIMRRRTGRVFGASMVERILVGADFPAGIARAEPPDHVCRPERVAAKHWRGMAEATRRRARFGERPLAVRTARD